MTGAVGCGCGSCRGDPRWGDGRTGRGRCGGSRCRTSGRGRRGGRRGGRCCRGCSDCRCCGCGCGSGRTGDGSRSGCCGGGPWRGCAGSARAAVGRCPGCCRSVGREPIRRQVCLRCCRLGGRERVPQLADDGSLDRRGRRLDELTHFGEFRHDVFACLAELFRKLVYAGLACHCSPYGEGGRATARPQLDVPGVTLIAASRRDHFGSTCFLISGALTKFFSAVLSS